MADSNHDRNMAIGASMYMLAPFVLKDDMNAEDKLTMLREFIELTASRPGAFSVLAGAKECNLGLKEIVAQLRQLRPSRPTLRLVVDNCRPAP